MGELRFAATAAAVPLPRPAANVLDAFDDEEDDGCTSAH